MIPASRIGAFFDIDGTLLPPPSLERRFASWLLDCGLLSNLLIVKWGMIAFSALLTGDAAALRMNKSYLGGLPTSVFDDWEATLPAGVLSLFPAAEEQLAFHLGRRHQVFLVSGTLDPLARALARRIGESIGVYATELGEIGGACSGSVEGKHLSGPAKADAIAKIARAFGISLAESHAYGNHLDDLEMLSSVGHPVAVNPTHPLKRVAQQRGWRTLRWTLSESANGFAAQQQPFSQRRPDESPWLF